MKVGALNEARDGAGIAIESLQTKGLSTATMRVAPSASVTSFAAPALSDDPRALLNEVESRFYSVVKTAVAGFDCQVLAKVHLPALTRRADESLQPAAALNRALAALRCWEADFAICRGDSLVVVAVLRLRSSDDSSSEPARANLEEALHCTLAAAHIPVLLFTETDSYDPYEITALILPHLGMR
jgi:hypothetical protein